ncbi:hypothetical protein [Radiobacillus sp. PE A8.2]|uniref:hypothetical protein n=1 Tax=Radiobacillus sp. PE A8.2 TaxID=3380349 RepID=UPI00389057C4
MIDVNQLDPANLATISAIVAALVTVLGNAIKLPTRFRALLAIGIAFILVFIPPSLLNKILTALVIGLTASGVYSQVKPMKFFQNLVKGNTTNGNTETSNSTTEQKVAPKNTSNNNSSTLKKITDSSIENKQSGKNKISGR